MPLLSDFYNSRDFFDESILLILGASSWNWPKLEVFRILWLNRIFHTPLQQIGTIPYKRRFAIPFRDVTIVEIQNGRDEKHVIIRNVYDEKKHTLSSRAKSIARFFFFKFIFEKRRD